MADSNKVDINFNAETRRASGEVKKFKGDIEAVGPSGKKTAATISGSFKTIESTIGKVRKAISMISFGTMWVDAVVNIINKFQDWREEIRKTAVEAQKLEASAKFAEQTAAVDNLSARYKQLAEDIAAAGRAAAENEKAANAALNAARSLEDARLDEQMANEVAALDRSDPAYSEKVSQIRQRYAGAKARLGAARGVEDAEAKQKEYENQAYDEDTNARVFSGNAERAREQEAAMKRKADLWRLVGYIGNAEDKGFDSERNALYESLTEKASAEERDEIFAAIKGMTGKEKQEYAKEQAGKYSEKADKAGESAKALDDKAAEAAAKSKTAAALADSQRQLVEAARTKQRAVRTESGTSDTNAEESVKRSQDAAAAREDEKRRREDEERQKREEEDRRIASARSAAPELQRQAEELKQRIAAEQSRKDAANYAAFQAQGDYDAARLGGNRRQEQGASNALHAAQEEALNVGHEADKAINALTEALKNVESRLKAAQSAIKQAEGRQRYAWSESPAGE